MTSPFRIFIDGEELLTWTRATLKRTKTAMTGSLTVDVFYAYTPTKPVMVNAVRARQILVYVAGQLAFTGKIDKRKGKTHKTRHHRHREREGGAGMSDTSSSMKRSHGRDGSYSVTITARGNTKYLIDSSHQHPTSTMLDTTNLEVIQKITQPWNIEIDNQTTSIKVPIMRLNDGGRVVDEINALSNDTCFFAYETRDGKLRLIDKPGSTMGDDLILSQNILDFDAEQSEDQANSSVRVKGQRNDPKAWGDEAIIGREKVISDSWVNSDIPLTIQMYGDGTDENLERRGKFELDRRSSQSKKVNVEVFHVQTTSGQPWDIGVLHYVEIPPEGIFDVFECTELTYTVTPEDIHTELTLTPPPSSGISGGAGGSIGGLLTNAITGLTDALARGVSRRIQLGITTSNSSYPGSWGAAELSSIVQDLSDQLAKPNSLLQAVAASPPLTLPDNV